MAKSKTTKGEDGEKGKRQYAVGADTATLEQPDSTRNQKAVLLTAPADVALKQVNTPSATTFETEDGGSVTAYPVTTELPDGTAVVEVEGGGHVAAGAFGKTATDKDGNLLRAKAYVDGRYGGAVTVGKDGKATVAAPKFPKGAETDEDRGHGPARAYAVERDSKAAARKGYTARKATKKASGGAKGKKAAASGGTAEAGS